MSSSPAVLAATGALALCLVAVALPVPGTLAFPSARPSLGASPAARDSPAPIHAPETSLDVGTAGGNPASVAVTARVVTDLLPVRTAGALADRSAAVRTDAAALARASPPDARPPLPRPTQPIADRGYRPPVAPAVLLAPFAAPPEPWRAGHRGVDLAASTGDRVHAPADGVVVFAGTVVDRDVLTILHRDGLRSSLEPVHVDVAVGMTVAAGDVVGTVQRPSHCDPGSCLHWGVRRGETYLDPLRLLPGGGPTVLLPVP